MDYEREAREAREAMDREQREASDRETAENERYKKIFKEALSETLDERDKGSRREQIMKEPNTAKRQKLIRENMELFK